MGAFQELPGEAVALPQPAYTGAEGSCIEVLIALGELDTSKRGASLGMRCYLLGAGERPQIISRVAQSLRRAGYALLSEIDDGRTTNQLWYNRAERSSADLSYWYSYRPDTLLSLTVRAARE